MYLILLGKVIDRKDAINRRQDNNQSFVLTAINRVSSLNRTVLSFPLPPLVTFVYCSLII